MIRHNHHPRRPLRKYTRSVPVYRPTPKKRHLSHATEDYRTSEMPPEPSIAANTPSYIPEFFEQTSHSIPIK